MKEEIIKISGKQPGPTSTILVGVHGNERCGIDALEKLLPTIKIQNGTVYFAYGNPRAIELNVRFIESNLNRMFKLEPMLTAVDLGSYEYGRAKYLKSYLDQTEVLLDIHASYTPKSKPFLICESNAREISKSLPFDLVVSGFDKIEPGGTDYYMNSIGKIGICAECGYLGDQQTAEVAEKTILSFLGARGHIKSDQHSYQQRFVQVYDLYITKNNFTLTKEFKDFEEISKGDIIGLDGGIKVKAEKKSIILFARNMIQPGQEAFLLGSYEKA